MPPNGERLRLSARRSSAVKYAMLVLKNLMRSKRRTVLTVFSIAVSLFIFSALVSLPVVANELIFPRALSSSSRRSGRRPWWVPAR